MKSKYAAVSLKTESGDDYLYLEKYDYVNDVLDCIIKHMGEELSYVQSLLVKTNYKSGEKVIKQLILDKIGEQ